MNGDLFGNDFTMPADANTDPLACAAPPKPAKFDGETFDEHRDGKRLTTQLQAVRSLLSDGKVWTLYELADAAGELLGRRVSTPGVSARIRDLRKPEHGGYDIVKHPPTTEAPGVWRYQMKKESA